MLRYDRQTKPSLVALYDIRPGNRAGPFLQPRSPPVWQVDTTTIYSTQLVSTATRLILSTYNWRYSRRCDPDSRSRRHKARLCERTRESRCT